MGHGTFYVGVAIGRYDIQKAYDLKGPAATVFIGSTSAVRGAVNCFRGWLKPIPSWIRAHKIDAQ